MLYCYKLITYITYELQILNLNISFEKYSFLSLSDTMNQIIHITGAFNCLESSELEITHNKNDDK